MTGERIAAIDIGTNSFHLQIMELMDSNELRLVYRRREVMRLLDFSPGKPLRIEQTQIFRGVELLREFGHMQQRYSARVAAAATSAVRDAENGSEFIEAVKQATGIHILPLTGDREAALIFKGAYRRMAQETGPMTVIDIGGGSTEIIFGDQGGIYFKKSFPAGVVRCSNMFFPGYRITQTGILRLYEFMEMCFEGIGSSSALRSDSAAVGTSGAIRNTLYLCEKKYPQQSRENYPGTILYPCAKEITEEVCAMESPESRTHILPPDPNRTDVMPCSLLMLTFLMEKLSLQEIRYSDYALREGLILSALEGNPI